MAEQAVRKPQRKGPALENVSSRTGLFLFGSRLYRLFEAARERRRVKSRKRPMRNRMARLITPMESRPVAWVKVATSRGPMTAANFPKISKKPKYSLERSEGMSLPK